MPFILNMLVFLCSLILLLLLSIFLMKLKIKQNLWILFNWKFWFKKSNKLHTSVFNWIIKSYNKFWKWLKIKLELHTTLLNFSIISFFDIYGPGWVSESIPLHFLTIGFLHLILAVEFILAGKMEITSWEVWWIGRLCFVGFLLF